jgi:hypothetical protein
MDGGVLGILQRRLAVELDGLGHRLLGARSVVGLAGAQVHAVGVEAMGGRGDARRRRALRRRREIGRDRRRHPFHCRDQIGGRLLEAPGPARASRGGVDEAHVQGQRGAARVQAHVHQAPDPQSSSPGDRSSRELSARGRHPGGNPQFRDLGEGALELGGQALRQVGELAPLTRLREGQHRQARGGMPDSPRGQFGFDPDRDPDHIAPAADRAQQLRVGSTLAQRAPRQADGLGEHPLGRDGIGPEGLQQLGLGDRAPGVGQQVLEQLQDLGLDRNRNIPPPQLVTVEVEREVGEAVAHGLEPLWETA